MEEAAAAMAMRQQRQQQQQHRSSEISSCSSGLPPQGSRRRRTSTSSAWPAFAGAESNRGLGRSPGPKAADGATSPAFSSSPAPGSACGSGRRMSGGGGGTRVSGCTSGCVVRTKASCCDSCRPAVRSGGGGRIEYGDVFGGPPRYLSSGGGGGGGDGRKSSPIPDYDDIFQASNRRSFSSLNPPHSPAAKNSKSRAAELPVFDPPLHEYDVFQGAAEKKPKSPAQPAAPRAQAAAAVLADEEIAYDDVFGGPLTGPRTKLLKDLLRCSGFLESKRKSGPQSRASPQSDFSPVSSIHSICRESIGNPVYEYESEVYGDGKHFNSPRKSPMGGPQKYGADNRKPVVTSVSASSSPFTEQFDDSTVHSYSSATRTVNESGFKPVWGVNNKTSEADVEVASSSSCTGSPESDYLRRPLPPKHSYGETRKARGGGKGRRPPRVRVNKRDVAVDHHRDAHFSEASSYDRTLLDRDKKFGEEEQADSSVLCDSSPTTERDFDFEVDLIRKKEDESGKKEAKQVSFITVSNVQLKTEPTSVPPVRPAPGKNVDVLSEQEMSELLETEAFMEYSIKDLDGLVAEEYLVSHESISESSPSTSSVSNSLKTSISGRSYEDEDSDHCYAKDSVSPDVEGDGELEKTIDLQFEVKDDVSEEVLPDIDESVLNFVPSKNVADGIKSNLEEVITSSSSSFGEQTSKEGTTCSDEMSSLCEFEEIVGETPERRKLRWERYQRASERVAKAMAEKSARDLELEREEIEKQRVAELLDDVINRWAAGKRGNLRALLSTLQYILWPECGWQPVSLIDIIEPVSVRKAYRKATLCVHPDKLQQKNASTEHRFIAAKVFDFLQEAWTSFNYEQGF